MGFTDAGRRAAQLRGLLVIPDVIASSSSAAMVCRQLAAGGKLSEHELWHAIEASIDARVQASIEEAKVRHVSVRDAFIAWAQREESAG